MRPYQLLPTTSDFEKVRQIGSHIVFLIIPLFFYGCQEDIVTPKGPTRLVVEGWVTDQVEPFQVSLSETVDFGLSGPLPRVTGAQVSIEDDQGNTYSLDQEVGPGLYQTSDSFAGVRGRSYRLQIMTPDGEQYASIWELLSPVPPIDTLVSNLNTFIGGFPTFNVTINIVVFVNYTDPQGKGDFYRWKIYIDGDLLTDPPNLLLAEDRIEDGNQRSLELNFGIVSGLRVRVEQMSLSESAHDFLSLLKSQTLDLGEPFGVAPAPILGNISNQNDPNQMVLGYFGASSVSSREISF